MSATPPIYLNATEAEDFRQRIDAIWDEVRPDLGARDERYISADQRRPRTPK